jgi:putative glutamine amidotransferase
MKLRRPAPLIGLPACVKVPGELPVHQVGEKYLRGVIEGAGAMTVIVPALGDDFDAAEMVARLDGLVLTGSPSNVEPWRYAGPDSDPGTLHDAQRDAMTLPLIRAAIEDGLPLLAICRGIQELNVALGGSLHQNVHDLPGKRDHRSDKTLGIRERYRPAHPVALRADGMLARLLGKLGSAGAIDVNSLHAQGIDRLAPGLQVEATAPDGLIEAVSLPGARGFVLGLQWHPEWPDPCAPVSQEIFTAFGDAAEARARRRLDGRAVA